MVNWHPAKEALLSLYEKVAACVLGLPHREVVAGWKTVSSIPLRQAVYCEDCENVTTTTDGCAVCGSHSVYSVEKLIRREVKP